MKKKKPSLSYHKQLRHEWANEHRDWWVEQVEESRITVAYKQLRPNIILKIGNKKLENYEVKKTKLE